MTDGLGLFDGLAQHRWIAGRGGVPEEVVDVVATLCRRRRLTLHLGVDVDRWVALGLDRFGAQHEILHLRFRVAKQRLAKFEQLTVDHLTRADHQGQDQHDEYGQGREPFQGGSAHQGT